MSVLGLKYGQSKIVKSIQLYLLRMEAVLNLPNKLNEIAVEVISQDLYDVLYILSFEELADFFKRTRKGQFGKFYGGISSDVLLDYADKYLSERVNYHTGVNDSKTEHEKGWRDPNEYLEDKQETVAVLLEKIKINEEIKKAQNE